MTDKELVIFKLIGNLDIVDFPKDIESAEYDNILDDKLFIETLPNDRKVFDIFDVVERHIKIEYKSNKKYIETIVLRKLSTELVKLEVESLINNFVAVLGNDLYGKTIFDVNEFSKQSKSIEIKRYWKLSNSNDFSFVIDYNEVNGLTVRLLVKALFVRKRIVP